MKNRTKAFLSLVLLIFFLAFSYSSVKAQTPPSFPSCLNPQGTLKVSYEDGTHGIVGSTITYTGSDKVYSVSDVSLIQCFCADDGSGIQTNWWKVSSLTQAAIDSFKNLGWFFVPSGSVWGLDDEAYLAQNINYSCLGVVLGTGGGDVLGLATTGNITLIYALASVGSLALFLGISKRRRVTSKKKSG